MAGGLIDIKKRINSVKKTKKITSALKMVSAAKLKKAEETLSLAKPYSKKITGIVKSIEQRAGGFIDHDYFKQTSGSKVLFVIIAADRGLCGGFNSTILKKAAQEIEGQETSKLDVVAIGSKTKSFIKKNKCNCVGEFYGVIDGMDFADSIKIAEHILGLYQTGEYERIEIVYNMFKSVVTQEVATTQFLPIDLVTDEQEQEMLTDFIYEPSEGAVLDNLLEQYLSYTIYKILCESYAAEQAARMTAMESATDNADDVISDLTLKYNRARQAAITTELTEIVSGAEALIA